ncbi:PEGA domain-containing protein [Pseudoflavitalea sp. G-6-1-2]|uniref:PEGA domain-containing protein n=1 Tax=Pseudoflavitalea sp. G-6-1-2 TaxID=2728841 RepID=UPI00146C30A3|nr:PEGA domain-containing protein [Pseudoflavitalea sp. G-6-1-2]NML20001.1 PEGA domain-containing protein [Pseudoflavitalea sp. G-6-1-2]
MTKNITYSLLLFLSVFILNSCATIISGSKQAIDISSEPTGAKITIDGKDFGKTPQLIEFHRKGKNKGDSASKKSYAVKLELDGYQPYEINITRKVNGWVFGNILIGGIIGVVIDVATGSMYSLTPKQIAAQPTKNLTTYKADNGSVYIAVTMHPDPSWEKIGTLTKTAIR